MLCFFNIPDVKVFLGTICDEVITEGVLEMQEMGTGGSLLPGLRLCDFAIS